MAAAAEEAKQWRNRIKRGGVRYAVREEIKRPQFGGDTGDPHPRGRRRRNPAPLCTVCGNPYQVGQWRAHTRTSGHTAARQVDYRPRLRNPARLEPGHADPKLREMSQRFHGRPDQILHLDPDQRRPPPVHVVKIGEERATVYRPPRGSERSGADWEHQAGDRGPLRRNASGRRILVADERGRVYLVHGDSGMFFDPDRGLVG